MRRDLRVGLWGFFVLLVAKEVWALPPSGGQGSFSISVGGKIAKNEVSRASEAYVALTIPLDRFAGRQRVALANDQDADVEKSVDESSTNAAAANPEFKAASQTHPRLRRAPWSSELARNTLRMAVLSAGLPRSNERLESIAARSRSSAVLPEVAVRGMHSTDESLRLSPALDDSYRYTQTGGAGVTLEARLTWKLDRLVFADEELGVERIRAERARSEGNLVERVARLFAVWERSRLLLENVDLLPEDQHKLDIKALEAEIELDVMTNGWFSEQLRKLPEAKQPAQSPVRAPGNRSDVRTPPTQVPQGVSEPEIAAPSTAKEPLHSEPAKAPEPAVTAKATRPSRPAFSAAKTQLKDGIGGRAYRL
jgi:hypothetical protein